MERLKSFYPKIFIRILSVLIIPLILMLVFYQYTERTSNSILDKIELQGQRSATAEKLIRYNDSINFIYQMNSDKQRTLLFNNIQALNTTIIGMNTKLKLIQQNNRELEQKADRNYEYIETLIREENEKIDNTTVTIDAMDAFISDRYK